MATKNDFEVHRTALALVQANRANDEAGIIAVLSMVKESDIGEFVVALTELVSEAFNTAPSAGWEAFVSHYSAAIDTAESQI
ncbi:hypothetical protein WBN73_05535 [Paenarthrobacter sp. CCNWLY172]|uniref:hypothetical protein n=1 Tax=unclassified Paenarthrobacter TaxID=2634190 RepID=UPI0030776F07